MPGRTTQGDLHINKPLSNIAINYRPVAAIAPDIAPVVSVLKKSDSYYIFEIADTFRVHDDLRAPEREAKLITRSASSDTFLCKGRALKTPISYEDMANADAAQMFASRQAGAEFVMDRLYLNWDYRVGSQVMSTSNVGSSSTVASQWNVGTGNDPIGNIDTAIENVRLVTGYKPNSLLFGEAAWKSFSRNSNVIDLIFGDSAVGAARVPTMNNVRALFDGMERVNVGAGVYNSAGENQTASLTEIYPDSVLAYYAPMRPDIRKPSFMYSFQWPIIKGYNWQVRTFDTPKKDMEEVQVGYYQDEKITASVLGFLITNVNCSQ